MIKYLVKQPNTQDQLVTNKKSPYIFNILAAPLNKKLVIFSHYLLIKSEEAIQSFIFFFISFFLYLFFSLFYLSSLTLVYHRMQQHSNLTKFKMD